MENVIVIIRGQVSSGKSPIANWLASLVNDAGKTAEIIDHRVFEFHDTYKDDLHQATVDLLQRKVDVGIICVGTGVKEMGPEVKPFTIEIQPHKRAYSLLNIIDPWDAADLETDNEWMRKNGHA